MLPATEPPSFTSVDALGAAPIVLTKRHPRSAPVGFCIPGPADRPVYRLVRLRFRIDYGRRVRPGGIGFVNLGSGSDASASVTFKPRRTDTNVKTTWTTVGVDGQRQRRTGRRAIRVDFWNYMLYADAKPGRHALTFEVRKSGRFRFRRVAVSAASGIGATTESPREFVRRAQREGKRPGEARPKPAPGRYPVTCDRVATATPSARVDSQKGAMPLGLVLAAVAAGLSASALLARRLRRATGG
jgi:hypothetical protein